jgi:hypothetical protein
VIRASYSPFDALTLQCSYMISKQVHNPGPGRSDTDRFLIDANWKF